MMATVLPFEVAGVRAELHTIKPAPKRGLSSWNDWDDPDVPHAAQTAYAVVVDGERIGVVSSKRGTSHRKAGRLIVQTYHPTEWVATMTGFYRKRDGLGYGDWIAREPGDYKDTLCRNAGDWFQQRREAAEKVLRTWQELTGG